MNDFDSIYYIHIPKTGGRWFQTVINPICNLKESVTRNYLSEYAEKNIGKTHFGWIPEINDSTFVTTIVRDPVMQLCSVYAHRNCFSNTWIKYKEKLEQNNILTNEKDFYNFFKNVNWEKEKNYMIEYIIKNKELFANSQSKHICYFDKNGFDDFLIARPDPDIKLLVERIKRINKIFIMNKEINHIVSIQEILQIMGINKNIKEIKKYIDINHKNDNFIFNKKYENQLSKKLYMQLSDNDKSKLRNLSPLDNLFYKLAERK